MPQQQKDIFDGRLVAAGENPNGVVQVTPNGISHDRGEGANHQFMMPGHNGPRWEMPVPETMIFGAPVVGAVSTRSTKRTPQNRNRTGE